MKIFLTGASGFIGKSLFLKLLEKNYDITVCIHKSDLFFDKNINTVYCDYTKDHDIHKWSKRLSGVDIIINTVGIIRETSKQKFEDLHFNAPTAIFKAAEKLKISKIIHISALGVAKNRTEKYLSTKYRCDKFLLNLKNKAIILRPSVVIGKEGGIFSFFFVD
jgi:nucleoside-diphosphate-sugar epimerase